jgi:peptidoglycan/xylan/chitin deacetylase (PgdA/CDA1 family)
MARIHIDGKQRHLGYFENTDAGKIAAAETFDMAVIKLHPNDETARINFPDKRPDYLRKLGFTSVYE